MTQHAACPHNAFRLSALHLLCRRVDWGGLHGAAAAAVHQGVSHSQDKVPSVAAGHGILSHGARLQQQIMHLPASTTVVTLASAGFALQGWCREAAASRSARRAGHPHAVQVLLPADVDMTNSNGLFIPAAISQKSRHILPYV
jgi:hypothetical protein